MTLRASNPRSNKSKSAQHAMKPRCFAPKQRNTLLQTLRYALNVRSDGELPQVFRLPVAVALKPGSQEELAARFNVPTDSADPRRRAFRSAMALYCRSSQYGHALLTCEQLFSIDMDPAGPPTDADREPGCVLIGPEGRKGAGPVRNKDTKPVIGGNAPAPTPAAPDQAAAAPPDAGTSPDQTPAAQAKPARASVPKHPQRPSHDRRMFHPDYRKRFLMQFCFAFGVDSEDELPAYLQEETAVPLRVGYSRDLSLRYNIPLTREKTKEKAAFGRAMGGYTKSRAYQHALLTFQTRFTIDMEPAEPITDEDRENAITALREMNRRRQERQAARQPYDPPPGHSCGQA